MKSFLRVLLALILLSPFLVLLVHFQLPSSIQYGELVSTIAFTALQALLCALFVLSLSLVCSLGLVGLKKNRFFIETIMILPSFIPSLFVILSALKLINPFPFGLWGIVIVQVLSLTGLISVLLTRSMEAQIGGWSELALVEGASFLNFYWVVIQFLKEQIFLLGFLVFSICFSSLTVPLVVGGYEYPTLEVLIYEKLMIDQSWSEALLYSLVQFVFIFLISFGLMQSTFTHKSTHQNFSLIHVRPLIVVSFIPVLVLAFGLLNHAHKGIEQFIQLELKQSLLLKSLMGTLFVSVTTGMISLCFLSLIAFSLPHENFRRFLIGYVAPSQVLFGFALYVFNLSSVYWAIAICLSLIQICYLYRLELDGKLKSLTQQYYIAKSLGASSFMTYKKIIWPQTKESVGYLAGLSAFWASGDFAITSILSKGQPTLALQAYYMINSYRLEAASVLCLLLIMIGSILWFIFWKAFYVEN